MISRLDQIDNKIQKEIIKKNQSGITVNKLLEQYDYTRNEILAILNGNVPINNLRNYLSNLDLEDKKILVISDVHLGSELENIKYLDLAYNFATYNNINTIINVGDIMQSTIRPVKHNLIHEEQQLEYIINNYPYDNSIENIILLGNHDYHSLVKSDEYIKVLKTRKDFNILGFKRAYLSWSKYLISLDHSIEKYRMDLPNVDATIRLIGHRHELKVNKNQITLPTLSDDTKIYGTSTNLPGFITLEMLEDKIVAYYYPINPLTNTPTSKQKITTIPLLKRKVK